VLIGKDDHLDRIRGIGLGEIAAADVTVRDLRR